MAEVKKRGYRVDFITMQSYMGKHAKNFLNKVERIHRLYGRPVWITEFAVADWSANKDKPSKYSPDDVLKFAESALPSLTVAGNGVLEVSFEAVSNRTYIFETTEQLSVDTVWSPGNYIGPFSTNGTQVLNHADPSNPESLFGRVRISL